MRRVGVLALQGDVREHVATLTRLGVQVATVRHVHELDEVDGLVIPGGESTTIAKLLDSSGLREAITKRLAGGMAAFGTCAGLIVLSSEVLDGRSDQWSFSALDVTVRRNGYGRQIASFETPIRLSDGEEVPGVFIRAPRIVRWGDDVDVLATHDHNDGEHPVLVRQGAVWGCSFHPELTTSLRVHQMFVDAL